MVHTEGNALSILVFFLWVPIALWGARRWPPAKAASLLLLLPLMFLPERVEFDLPGLPGFTKDEIAVIWLLIGATLFHRDRLRTRPTSSWIRFSIVLLLVGQAGTVFLNMDNVTLNSKYLVGHSPYDAVRAVISTTIRFVVPFILGTALFRNSKDLRVLLRFLVGATLAYGIFQLIEVRLSPQFHNWVYGFFQHSFMQMKREGGFRPIVFMAHGLTVAMFTAVGLMAAATMFKAKIRIGRVKTGWAIVFLGMVAIFNKSVAAMLYSLMAVPLILFTNTKTQFRVGVVLAVVVLAYPSLRRANAIPVYSIRDALAEQFGEERAASLTTRLVNEEAILERALERPFFGWGTYGRSFEYGPKSGKQISIPDGDWVNTIGMFGFIGFLGKYLLMLLPIFWTSRRLRYVPRELDRILLAGLGLILAFSVFDHLPNSSAHYLPFIFAGALFGTSSGIVQEAAQRLHLRRAGEPRNELPRRGLLPSVDRHPLSQPRSISYLRSRTR